MNEISRRIAELLGQRRCRLPLVRKEIERWRRTDDAIEKLEAVVHDLRRHAGTPLEIKQGLAGLQTEDLRKGISQAIDELRVVEARYARGTVNIGVSGRARVGKSTMLQSISGLTDQQIPTGKGLPVTAVRSRIFHSSSHQRATLLLHSFDTFRDEILQPYHDELGLPGAPIDVETFQRSTYPVEAELPAATRRAQQRVDAPPRSRDAAGAVVIRERSYRWLTHRRLERAASVRGVSNER